MVKRRNGLSRGAYDGGCINNVGKGVGYNEYRGGEARQGKKVTREKGGQEEKGSRRKNAAYLRL